MTLQEHTDCCLELIKQGYAELPVIYSQDSEGNSYSQVNYEPQLVLAENPNSYYLDLIEVDENEEFEPNCIIIN